MICKLDASDFCERHQRHHKRREKTLSQMNNAQGERYRKLWDKEAGIKEAPVLPGGLECVHRGDLIREQKCDSCRGNVNIKVFACALHGECTMFKKIPGVHKCDGCAARKPPEPRATLLDRVRQSDPAPVVSPPFIRNLIYHIYPVKGKWYWHAEKLRRRISLFNGRRILAIAYDGNTDPPSVVKEAFADMGFEFIEVENNPNLREVQSFPLLFGAVSKLTGPDQVTLFAQAKSVTRDLGSPCQLWTDVMYETCFDYWPVVESLLCAHPVVGSFKKLGRGWPSHESLSDWHYSGSWFWFRNKDLFERDWQRIDKFWAGIEPYPSLHFPPSQAGTIFYEAPVPQMNLYSWKTWNERVQPAYDKWKRDNHSHASLLPYSILDVQSSTMTCATTFLNRLATLKSPRVIEIGTRGWNGMTPKHMQKAVLEANEGAKWLGVDLLEGDGVDVVCDAHELSKKFQPGEFDAFVCNSTLEHVRRPWVVAAEIAKVVKPGGIGLLQTHQSFPIHGYPNDYFRFSKEAIAELFGSDNGWRIVQAEYQCPCRVIPTSNVFVHACNWNFEAEAFLNVEAVVERMP